MNLFEAIIMGIVQGLTEFIPVSSSGHLVIMHEFFGITENALAFDVALHFGTLAALVIFFLKDLKKYAIGLFKKTEDSKLAWLLVLATLPAALAGYLLQSQAETSFRSVKLVALNLAAFGLVMLLAEYFYKKLGRRELSDLSAKPAFLVGLAQSLAIVPGISRSGSTIVAGMLTGLNRVAAARFSFLLGVPIIFGAVLKVFLDGGSALAVSDDLGIFLAGTITAFLSGLFAIRFMLRFLNKRGLSVFAYYRIALAAVVFLIF